MTYNSISFAPKENMDSTRNSEANKAKKTLYRPEDVIQIMKNILPKNTPRPEIADGNIITIFNTKTRKAEQAKVCSEGLVSIFENLNKYSTKEDPNIRYNKNEHEEVSEVWEMTENIYSSFNDLDVYTGQYSVSFAKAHGRDLMTKYNDLIDHYTNENSLGGKDITKEEVQQMEEKLFNWYKDLSGSNT